MSILVDHHEPEDMPHLLRQMGIEVQVGDYNASKSSEALWPDYMVINGDPVGVNRKQAVEAMADLDRVEDQLRRELRHCGKLVFVYEGCLTFTEEGTYAGDAEFQRVQHKTGRDGNEYDVLNSRGRVLAQPYTRWTRFVWKCQDDGIPVVGTGNLRGTAVFLHNLHQGHENNLFQRLIRVRQDIMEEDPKLRVWKLFLMGIPGIGPEAAVCLTDVFPNMTQLVCFLSEGGVLADLPLPSGRHLGKALETQIRGFLGIHPHLAIVSGSTEEES